MVKNSIFSFVFSLMFGILAFSKTTANIDKEGVLLQGYDPVSYFTESQPLKGNPQFKASADGVTYYFASEKNKNIFVADPKKYSPQYEGWCATAVAKGSKYKIDPTSYKITDGKLYLFYREDGWFGGDAKKEWLKDEPTYLKKADSNWPQVKESKE